MKKQDYKGAEKHVFTMLEKGLNKNLHYHNLPHTKDVIEVFDKLAESEAISEEEYSEGKAAALCHDTGFLIRYKENEQIGAGIARGALGRYGYSNKQIENIAEMIMATKLPQNPKTFLGGILCDADVDNFGREDFFEKGILMRKELEGQNIKMSDKQWYENTLKLLENHKYFTDSAKKLRQEKKEDNIRKIKELIEIKQY